MKVKRILLVLLGLALTAGAATALAAQGDQSDPLVTLSYLQKVFAPQVEERLGQLVQDSQEELKAQLDLAATSYETRVDETLAQSGVVFQSRDLAQGDSFLCKAGREVLLVSGQATASGDLTDVTAGAVVPDGAPLTAGHLYLTTADNTGLRAASAARVMSR